MPTHLTRVVFRRIAANRPLTYRGCLYRSLGPRPTFQNAYASRLLAPASQRRTFLNLAMFKPKRKAQPPQIPPGQDVLADLAKATRLAEKPPPPDQVYKALMAFVGQATQRFENSHIGLMWNAVNYLRKEVRDEGTPWLKLPDIQKLLQALGTPADKGAEARVAFAVELHEELARRAEEDESLRSHPKKVSLGPHQRFFYAALCRHGATLQARDSLVQLWQGGLDESERRHRRWESLWAVILYGFGWAEKNGAELVKTVEIMEELSVPFRADSQRAMVQYFAESGQMEEAKKWYDITPEDGKYAGTHAAMLKACVLADDQALGQKIVASMLEEMPSKPTWDAIFVWSAAIGKGVDEIDRMMDVMIRRNDQERAKPQKTPVPVIRPDIQTINALVELAISKDDPYTAERYIALGERRGIHPDAHTCTMQINYRLSANDIVGALAAYHSLEGVSINDDAVAAAANKLIRAMCGAHHHTFDDVLAIVDDLHEHKAWFDPDTIAILCENHLRRGELQDAVDLIQLHAHFYSGEQRLVIRNHLLKFLLDRETSTADAWDTYQMIRKLFPETPRELRLKIMNEFFARKRGDMGCHVFFHMRQADHPTIRADRTTYIAAFTGFARTRDAESLELAHNQLKLDVSVDMDTQLRNALMLAYAAVGKNIKALEYWTEIVASKEGPTYNSIVIALRACEGMPWGDRHAKPIWRRLVGMGMEIDKRVFTAYVGALASNFLHDECVTLVEKAEEEWGFEVDLYMLANWFNATHHIANQAKVEAWIREHYPEIWAQMEELGHEVTMDGFGYRQLNYNRDLEP